MVESPQCRFHAPSDGWAVACVEIDATAVVVAANRVARGLAGAAPDGRPLAVWLNIEDPVAVESACRAASRHGRGDVDVRADGRELRLHLVHCAECGRLAVTVQPRGQPAEPVPGAADVLVAFDALPLAAMVVDRDEGLVAITARMAADFGLGSPELLRSAVWRDLFGARPDAAALAAAVATAFGGNPAAWRPALGSRVAREFVVRPGRRVDGAVASVVVEEHRAAPVEGGRRGAAPPAAAARGGATVLVVDDDDSVRSMVCRTLLRAGHRVDDAADAQAALKLAAAADTRFDVLVTDVVLRGGVSGPELAEQMQSEQLTASVLFVSGWAVDGIVDDIDPERAQGFLAKPFRAEHLTERVAELLRIVERRSVIG